MTRPSQKSLPLIPARALKQAQTAVSFLALKQTQTAFSFLARTQTQTALKILIRNRTQTTPRFPALKQSQAILRILALAGLLLFPLSCKDSYTPKPMGYVRIDYPEKTYRLYDEQPQYSFEIPEYAQVEPDRSRNAEAGWINVHIPRLNGTIHLSYKPVEDNLNAFITDSRDLVYKHTVKAQGIEDTPFMHREESRFGMIYDLKGDVASAVQFFVTDSTTHFLRGSLYFNSRPNRDSLNPVIEFLREDIIHLIETTTWKY